MGVLFCLALLASCNTDQARLSTPDAAAPCPAGTADCEDGGTSGGGGANSPIEDPAPASEPMKWHPGHYVKTQGQHCSLDQDGYYAGVRQNMEEHVGSSDKFLGAYVIFGWGALETDKGVYDWTRVYDTLEWLAARDKYLLVGIEHKCYGGMTNPEWVVPKNLESEVTAQKEGIIGALWREKVMNQYVEFLRAFAAEFDDHPNVEMVSFIPETCPGFGTVGQPVDYSNSGYSAQIQRLYGEAGASFKHTVFTGGVNCPMSGEAVNLVEALYQNGEGRAGPDAHAVDGYKVFKGEEDAVRDYRGLIPHRVIVSAPNLGGFSNILPLTKVQKMLSDGHVTHVAWVLTSQAPGGRKIDIVAHIEQPANTVFQDCPQRLNEIRGGCE